MQGKRWYANRWTGLGDWYDFRGLGVGRDIGKFGQGVWQKGCILNRLEMVTNFRNIPVGVFSGNANFGRNSAFWNLCYILLARFGDQS